MKALLVAIALLVVCAAALDGHTFAWVDSNGYVHRTSSKDKLQVTKIATGVYCFNFANSTYAFPSYAAVAVTLQGSLAASTVGYASANTGWGNACNPYGGAAVFTFTTQGIPSNFAFSMIVDY